MKEILFKAVDKKYKYDGKHKVFRICSIDFINSEVTIIVDEDRANQEQRKFHEIEFLQYTGLKDKNGKEIYEGNILEQEDGRRCEVFWNDYNGIFDLRCIVSKGVPYSLQDRCYLLQEIIGNIYENPELLKDIK